MEFTNNQGILKTFKTQQHTTLRWLNKNATPIPSMYGILAYIWLKLMANVGKYHNMDAMGHKCMVDLIDFKRYQQKLSFMGIFRCFDLLTSSWNVG